LIKKFLDIYEEGEEITIVNETRDAMGKPI
jgi:hypothetical protein